MPKVTLTNEAVSTCGHWPEVTSAQSTVTAGATTSKYASDDGSYNGDSEVREEVTFTAGIHGVDASRNKNRLWEWLTDEHLRRSVPAMLDQAMVSLAAFATVAILGRYAGQKELGRYYLPFTILLLSVNIQGELVTSAFAVYRQRRRGRELAEYSGSTIVFQGILTVIGMLLFALLWGLAFCGWMSADLADCFFALILAGPLWQVRAFLRYYCFAHLQFFTPLLMDTIATVGQLLVLYSFALLGWLSAPAAHAALGVAGLVGLVVWSLLAKPRVHIRIDRLWGDWRLNWSFARWALASQLVGCICPYILPWLVAIHVGQEGTGVLAASTNLCGIATMFVLGIAHSLTPHAARAYARGGVPQLRRVLWRAAIAFLVGLGAFCLIMMFFGERLMLVLYGPRFGNTQILVTLLALATLANSMAIVAGNGLWAMDQPRANLWADAVTLVVTLSGALALLPIWGIMAVPVAVLVGNTLGAATRIAVLCIKLQAFTQAYQTPPYPVGTVHAP